MLDTILIIFCIGIILTAMCISIFSRREKMLFVFCIIFILLMFGTPIERNINNKERDLFCELNYGEDFEVNTYQSFSHIPCSCIKKNTSVTTIYNIKDKCLQYDFIILLTLGSFIIIIITTYQIIKKKWGNKKNV